MEGFKIVQEKTPMGLDTAAEYLGLSSSATSSEIIAAYDAIMEGDKRTSEWQPERSTLDETGVPAELDWLVADLRAAENTEVKEAPSSQENLPALSDVAASLEAIGFACDANNPQSVLAALDAAEAEYANGDGQGGDPLAAISLKARASIKRAI